MVNLRRQIMNSVILIGRLCADPQIRQITGENSTAIATFTLAIDRPPKKRRYKTSGLPEDNGVW